VRRFRLGQIGGRHLLLDPNDRPFFSLGVVHTAAFAEHDGVEAFEQHYGGDWGRLSQRIVSDLRDWGFNTVGYHGPLQGLPLLPALADAYPAPIAYWMGEPRYPDVFDPAYRRAVEAQLEQVSAPRREHANLVGYYWTDTPRWDLDRARELTGSDWVSSLRSRPAAAPGKRRYVDFLLETIDGPDALRVYAGAEGATHQALLERDFRDLDTTKTIVREHDAAFLRLIAREYYAIAAAATRQADPGRLIFGDRYLAGDHPPQVLEEALPHVDAIALQPLGVEFDRALFERLHEQTGKPLLVCDHAVNFYTPEHPMTVWEQVPSEAQAARAYADYLRDLFECPWVLGYHRCQYIDRVAPDGRTLKQGLLQKHGAPHSILVEQVARTNRAILAAFEQQVRSSGRGC
jgi:hypothetical protein